MNASAIGTVVHQQLQRICEEGVQLWTPERIKQLANEYRLQLKLNGVGNAHLKTCVGRVVKGLVQSIEDERGRWVLDNSHAQSSNELALSTVNDAGELQQVVLDRVFIDSEGTRWIVDYKTGDHRGGSVEEFLDRECERYKPQLENYARIVKKLVDQQNEVPPDPARVPKIAGQAELRVALYFPLLRGWRAWEPRM